MNMWSDSPVVWTYPSLVHGVMETLYVDCVDLAPASTYRANALKAGARTVVLPSRETETIQTPAVADKDGKVVRGAVYAREVVKVTEYKTLMAAATAKRVPKAGEALDRRRKVKG